MCRIMICRHRHRLYGWSAPTRRSRTNSTMWSRPSTICSSACRTPMTASARPIASWPKICSGARRLKRGYAIANSASAISARLPPTGSGKPMPSIASPIVHAVGNIGEAMLGIGFPEPVGGSLAEIAEALFAIAQPRFNLLASLQIFGQLAIGVAEAVIGVLQADEQIVEGRDHIVEFVRLRLVGALQP